MHSPELQAQIALWRQKAADGSMSLDDWKVVVIALRGGRLAAAASSTSGTRKRAMKEIQRADDLLGELERL